MSQHIFMETTRIGVVCEDCFQKMHPKDHPKLVNQAKEKLDRRPRR